MPAQVKFMKVFPPRDELRQSMSALTPMNRRAPPPSLSKAMRAGPERSTSSRVCSPISLILQVPRKASGVMQSSGILCAVAALFTGNGLKVQERLIPDPNVSVIFKDGRSLINFLLSRDRDILRLLLSNEVVLRGNANYLFKFAYMANHLQLALTGKLP